MTSLMRHSQLHLRHLCTSRRWYDLSHLSCYYHTLYICMSTPLCLHMSMDPVWIHRLFLPTRHSLFLHIHPGSHPVRLDSPHHLHMTPLMLHSQVHLSRLCN